MVDMAQEEAASLRRTLDDARQQLAATSQVLTAMGRSASDPESVLGTIVESARRLCRADQANLFLLDEDRFRLVRSAGTATEIYRDLVGRHPLRLDRATLIGRVGLDRTTQQVEDVLADPEYGRADVQQLGGFRSVVAAPMLLDDAVIGTLGLWRSEVAPFDQATCDVLSTFAAQAAIAVHEVQLVRALEERSNELARRVAELEALNEVGDAVSSILDLDRVLATVVASAVELSGTDGGSMFEYDQDQRLFVLRTAHRTEPELVERLQHTRIDLENSLIGQAAIEARTLEVADLDAIPQDDHLRAVRAYGWRSLLVVPLLREGRVVGALVVRRRTTGGFATEVRELLETFASQSALAILNARLFGELAAKRAELEAVSEHKSDFLASMSHELRTPLNAVIGFSEVLLERMIGELNDRQDEYLRDIHGAGKHLLELLNEILDLSKIEAGRMDLDRAPFRVEEVLQAGLALVRERAAQHGIKLELDTDPDPGMLVGDVLRFKQVVLNLLSNAVKFTPDGGRVGVCARRQQDELLVSVTDTGPGVAEDDRNRIFESFQQGGRGVSREEGTGLGLTLSRRLVELMGGRLWLDGQQGQGSTFSFAVPLAPTPMSAAAEAVVAPARSQPLVALIEDDRVAVDLVTLHLESAGYGVATARDGLSGLDMIERSAPDAIVLDIRLPGLDGWGVLERLRQNPATSSVPVVVVSVLDERPRGLSHGAAEYLVKPVSRERLLDALLRVGVPAPGPPDQVPAPG